MTENRTQRPAPDSPGSPRSLTSPATLSYADFDESLPRVLSPQRGVRTAIREMCEKSARLIVDRACAQLSARISDRAAAIPAQRAESQVASGQLDAYKAFADSYLGEYDLDSWTVPDLSLIEDLRHARNDLLHG